MLYLVLAAVEALSFAGQALLASVTWVAGVLSQLLTLMVGLLPALMELLQTIWSGVRVTMDCLVSIVLVFFRAVVQLFQMGASLNWSQLPVYISLFMSEVSKTLVYCTALLFDFGSHTLSILIYCGQVMLNAGAYILNISYVVCLHILAGLYSIASFTVTSFISLIVALAYVAVYIFDVAIIAIIAVFSLVASLFQFLGDLPSKFNGTQSMDISDLPSNVLKSVDMVNVYYFIAIIFILVGIFCICLRPNILLFPIILLLLIFGKKNQRDAQNTVRERRPARLVQERPRLVQERPRPVQARPRPVQARPRPVQARPVEVAPLWGDEDSDVGIIRRRIRNTERKPINEELHRFDFLDEPDVSSISETVILPSASKRSGSSSSTTAHEDEKIASKLRQLEEQLNKEMEAKVCVVCLDQPRQMMIRPCNHYCVCKSCTRRLRKCPICNARIVRVEKIYNV